MAQYDVNVINRVIDEFKERKRFLHSPTTLMFDADNTLYRFSNYGASDWATREMYSKHFIQFQLPFS